MATEHFDSKLAAIFYADVAGYSRLTGQDEEGTHRTLRVYLDLMAAQIELRRGTVVHYAGDAVLAEFASAVDALSCAVEFQRELERRNTEHADENKIQFRIGINLGEVIIDRGDIYGNGVNIAARLESLAESGGICISQAIRDAVGTKLPLTYEFMGEQQVKNIAEPVRAYRVKVSADSVMPAVSQARPSEAPRRPNHRFAVWGAALVVLAAVIGGSLWIFYPRVSPSPIENIAKENSVLALPTGPSIAVLPFTNMSGDPEQDYFSDGVTEEIITELTRFRELFVIARNTTFRYKGKAVDIREVGRDLGVLYVLEGSVRRASDTTIRVTAQLLDASSGAHLWAETYERNLTVSNIFGVQDDITEHVVGAIADVYGVLSRVGLKEAKSRETENLDAYECVLYAREYYSTNASSEMHLEARNCLERMVKLDPNYVEISVWLALIYLDEYRYGHNPYPQPPALDRALEAALQAVSLDPTSTMAHYSLASVYFFRNELERFAQETEKALTLNPNNALVLAELGNYLGSIGEFEQSMALTQKAMALNPSFPGWYWATVFNYHYHYTHDYEKALTAAQEWNEPNFYWDQVHLAQAYAQLERKEEALAAVKKLLELYPEFLQNAREEFLMWNYSEDMIEHEINGLRKAGLEIPLEE